MSHKHIFQLQKLCRYWGGDLIICDSWFEIPTSNSNYHEAPFTRNVLGQNWKQKKIYCFSSVLWVEVIHEMAHVFVQKQNPERVSGDDEFDVWGWEWAVRKYIKGSIKDFLWSNRDFQFGDGRPLKSLRRKGQLKMMKDRLDFAKKIGIVTKDGRPIAIR